MMRCRFDQRIGPPGEGIGGRRVGRTFVLLDCFRVVSEERAYLLI